jgi:uncharacterized protein YjiK
MKVILFNLFFLLIFACNTGVTKHNIKYDFENPNKDIRLDDKLNEVSGLCLIDSNTIACVNDEKGKIYTINLKTFKQDKLLEFKNGGDFEGIVKVKKSFYVLKSDGSLYKVKSNGEFKKYELFDKGFEFEGLTVSIDEQYLLIACKKHKSKKKDDFIWVFKFSLGTKKLMNAPYLKLKKDGIRENFKPSGLAFHPNGNLFILSGVSKTIIEFDKNLVIINQVQLPSFKYPQAEGICFDKLGSMYLSSEKNFLEKGKLYQLKEL